MRSFSALLCFITGLNLVFPYGTSVPLDVCMGLRPTANGQCCNPEGGEPCQGYSGGTVGCVLTTPTAANQAGNKCQTIGAYCVHVPAGDRDGKCVEQTTAGICSTDATRIHCNYWHLSQCSQRVWADGATTNYACECLKGTLYTSPYPKTHSFVSRVKCSGTACGGI